MYIYMVNKYSTFFLLVGQGKSGDRTRNLSTESLHCNVPEGLGKTDFKEK